MLVLSFYEDLLDAERHPEIVAEFKEIFDADMADYVIDGLGFDLVGFDSNIVLWYKNPKIPFLEAVRRKYGVDAVNFLHKIAK